jgi:NAD(P)-dependent dehydrogenase (short-subunit alcohol dehydrogenase family)
MRVAIWDRDVGRGAAVAAETGGSFHETDVRDPIAVSRALEETLSRAAVPRLLVTCAGVGALQTIVGPDGAHDQQLFERVVRVNLCGTFNCARLVAAAMSQSAPEGGERGLIVMTSSILSSDGQAGQAAYAASKAGIEGMVLPIARDLSGFGIRCVAIAPGMFDTPMLAGLPSVQRERLLDSVPFPARLGYPTEFAALVVAVAGNPMLNGTVIRLDGAARMPIR